MTTTNINKCPNHVCNGEIKIKVEKAKGKKCDRCWKILERRCNRENCPIK